MPFPSRITFPIASTSTATSEWWWTGDFRTVIVSWQSSASLGPSRFTVQQCQDDGFQTTLPTTTSSVNVSVVTGVNMIGVTPGMASLTSDGGYRWLRVTVAPVNHSEVSVSTIQFTGIPW